jgi:hypothetical protein
MDQQSKVCKFGEFLHFKMHCFFALYDTLETFVFQASLDQTIDLNRASLL